MVLRASGTSLSASVSQVKLRASVSFVSPTTASVVRVVPVAQIDYVLLAVAAALDTSGRYRYVADAFVVADGVAITLSKPISTPFVVVDAPPVLSVGKNLNDTVSFTEVFSAVLVFIRSFSETQPFSDSYALSVTKPLSDSVVIQDLAAITFSRTFYDAFAMNDTFDLGDGAVFMFTKSVNNVFFVSDSFSPIMTKNLSETVGYTDSGAARMQSYCDITYFAEDYVGVSFTF